MTVYESVPMGNSIGNGHLHREDYNGPRTPERQRDQSQRRQSNSTSAPCVTAHSANRNGLLSFNRILPSFQEVSTRVGLVQDQQC